MNPRKGKFDVLFLVIAISALIAIAIVMENKRIIIPTDLIDEAQSLSLAGAMSGTIG